LLPFDSNSHDIHVTSPSKRIIDLASRLTLGSSNDYTYRVLQADMSDAESFDKQTMAASSGNEGLDAAPSETTIIR